VEKILIDDMALKLLFLSHRFYPDVGGIEVNSEVLANAFHKAGFKVRLLTWSKEAGDKEFSFEIKRNPGPLLLLRLHLWADLVYENNPCLRLSWPAFILGTPIVTALRTWINRSNGKMGWQDQLKLVMLNRAKGVIAVSNSVREKCWPPAEVIPNPYRAEVFRKKPDEMMRAGFVFLGRLVSDKGADVAIRAFNRLLLTSSSQEVEEENDLHLTIIGDGPEQSNLKSLVHDLGLNDNVSFTGILQGEALVTRLNQHKYILVPSLWEEPFGNVALEGMACGCIPIVSDGGGLPEAVGKAGLVFARGDEKKLAGCMRSIISNKSLVTMLRHAAGEHLAHHHPDVITKKYIAVLEKVNVSKKR
jgi:glycosyltransferase involved in cell wall biosynthesis